MLRAAGFAWALFTKSSLAMRCTTQPADGVESAMGRSLVSVQPQALCMLPFWQQDGEPGTRGRGSRSTACSRQLIAQRQRLCEEESMPIPLTYLRAEKARARRGG
jgi:hypothetical protein